MEIEYYRRDMDSNNKQTRKIYGIHSFNQQLFSTATHKVVLTSFYDKTKMIDSINTEPFGYDPNKFNYVILIYNYFYFQKISLKN